MNRDWFRRPQRFTFAFGSLEDVQDPIGGTFELPVPRRFDELTSRPLCIQEDGEQRGYWARPKSPISTPGGRMASMEGRREDKALMFGVPMPLNLTPRKQGPSR